MDIPDNYDRIGGEIFFVLLIAAVIYFCLTKGIYEWLGIRKGWWLYVVAILIGLYPFYSFCMFILGGIMYAAAKISELFQ